MEDLFKDVPDSAVEPTPKVENSGNEAKRKKIMEMKEAVKEAIEMDPEYSQKLNSLSGSLEVVNSLGFGDKGNIIEDKSRTEQEGERKFATVSKIVGYRVRNIGQSPISYQTEVWSQDENGVFVPNKVERQLNPGETADLTRQFMTMLTSAPEFAFTLANGRMTRGSGRKGDSVKEELEAHYFSFDKGTNLQVNDDEIKLNVAEKNGNTWVVKPEFQEIFGYLNNAPAAKKSGRTASNKVSAQELSAAYVRKMLRESGM